MSDILQAGLLPSAAALPPIRPEALDLQSTVSVDITDRLSGALSRK